MLKKITLVSIILGLLVMSAAVVGAQDNTQPIVPQQDRFNDMRDRMSKSGFDLGDGEFLAILERYTGLTIDELNTEMLDNGQTIAQLIEANGGDVNAFVAEVTAPAFEQIDAAVEAGRVDAERAEELKTTATERLVERVNTVRERPGLNLPGANASAELVEQYTGLTVQEAATALRGGQTLAELIEANGASVDDFIAAAVAEAEVKIDERTAQLKAELPDRITDAVNGNFTNLRPDGGLFDNDRGPRGNDNGGRGGF